MNNNRIASKLFFIGGVAELLMAAIHFMMPGEINHVYEFTTLPDTLRSGVYHAIIAVGFCLMIFGFLSIYFSKKVLEGEQAAWVFGLSQGILWVMRVASEIALPIKIPLFYLSNPTTIILPLVILTALSFLIPTFTLSPGKQGNIRRNQ